MFQRLGSKRYSVAKNENQWVKKHYGKFISTPQVVINENRHSYRKRSQQLCLIILPVMEIVIMDLCILACYLIGIQNSYFAKVPFVPYASQLSVGVLGRGLLALGLICSSLIFVVISILRYKQIILIYGGVTNKLSMACAIGSVVSKIFMAAFPFNTGIAAIDYATFISYFSFTISFCLIQTILTRKTPTISSRMLFVTRLILTEFIFAASGIFAIFQHPKLSHRNQPPYSISQVAQWILIVFIQLFQLTFAVDMNQLYFAFDVWIASRRLEPPMSRSHLLESVAEDDERGTIITTDDNENDEYCMMRTEV